MGGDEEQLIMGRLRIRLSHPNLAAVGVGAELGKNTRNNFLIRGHIPTTIPVGNRVNFTSAPMGNRVKFHFKSHKMFIHSISIALSNVEDCQYTDMEKVQILPRTHFFGNQNFRKK